MKCPKCSEELPDDYDLPFCDQCNTDLFKCQTPDCSFFGKLTTNAMCCPKCGENVVPNGPQDGAAPVPPPVQTPQQQPVPAPQQSAPPQQQQQFAPATEAMAGTGSRLFLCHSDGWKIELAHDDIIGRVNGRFTDKLGNIKVISGTHAKITKAQDGWYIADQNSKNKTWVNGKEAAPYAPVLIKQHDVVTMANQKFVVTLI